MDSLKPVTAEEKSPMTTSQTEEKYRVVAPEAMHETFMSDSEEEGGTFSLLSFVWNSQSFSSNQFHTHPHFNTCMPQNSFDLPFDWPTKKKLHVFNIVLKIEIS